MYKGVIPMATLSTLECVCRVCHIQYDVFLRWLVCFLLHDVVPLHRSFVITERVSLY